VLGLTMTATGAVSTRPARRKWNRVDATRDNGETSGRLKPIDTDKTQDYVTRIDLRR